MAICQWGTSVISQAGQVVGSLAIYSMGQWYGGQCVPMAGIAAVGVAPEHRGNGVAWELMRRTLLPQTRQRTMQTRTS